MYLRVHLTYGPVCTANSKLTQAIGPGMLQAACLNERWSRYVHAQTMNIVHACSVSKPAYDEGLAKTYQTVRLSMLHELPGVWHLASAHVPYLLGKP